jgi:hypothetical protein
MADRESNTGKVNLELLKRLVSELETALEGSEAIRAAEGNPQDYIVEMSKSMGLCSGIVQEASLLIVDISSLVKSVSAPAPKKESLLDFLSGTKLSGGSN